MMFTFVAAAAAATLTWSPTATTTAEVEFSVVHAVEPRGVVVYLHGWSHGLTADDILPMVPETPVVGQLASAGWSVYAPFLDEDWGTGIDTVDEVLEQATADGYDTTRVRLFGVSSGAATALNWAWRNPDRVADIWVVTPVFDLDAIHELDTPVSWAGVPSITASLDERYGPDFDEQSEAYDPAEHVDELEALAGRLWVFGARDDELIDWGRLEDWCDDIGVPVAASSRPGELGGGHGFAMYSVSWQIVATSWFGETT